MGGALKYDQISTLKPGPLSHYVSFPVYLSKPVLLNVTGAASGGGCVAKSYVRMNFHDARENKSLNGPATPFPPNEQVEGASKMIPPLFTNPPSSRPGSYRLYFCCGSLSLTEGQTPTTRVRNRS